MARQIGADPVWLQKQFVHYCEALEAAGKYQLYLWPYHCLLGSNGHRLAGVVEEARLFHSFARGAANLPEIKGGNPLSERYSIFKEEVTTCWDGRPIPGAQKNTRLIKTLLQADMVVLAGLASSHCVKESIADLLSDIQAHDPALARKVYILQDCTAPVVIPGGPDFTDDAERALQNFRDAGMHLVTSTTPLQSWPDRP
jgi:nicotinamidase-related amidase